MQYNEAENIMGQNFIGPEKLKRICDNLDISIEDIDWEVMLPIPFDEKYLKSISKTHILILYVPKNKSGEYITLNSLKNFIGLDPEINEPCFYNQDWYQNEDFANKPIFNPAWFCIRKEVLNETRGKLANKNDILPSALICTFTFFATYYCNNEILWKYDYVWCNDLDSNGDRIFIGRYIDSMGIAKNGFSIHRHLSIKDNYGSI